MNSPLRDTVVNDNRRYLRFDGDFDPHPAWLGYLDRYIFPPYETVPSYFFVRKFFARGTLYGEKELTKWIKEHRNINMSKPCILEYAYTRSDCTHQYGASVAVNNLLILIPVNHSNRYAVEDLVCALEHYGKGNIVFWSLGVKTHDEFLQDGRFSMYLPRFKPTETKYSPGTSEILRLISPLIKAGFDVLYLSPTRRYAIDKIDHLINSSDMLAQNDVNGTDAPNLLFIRSSVRSKELLQRKDAVSLRMLLHHYSGNACRSKDQTTNEYSDVQCNHPARLVAESDITSNVPDSHRAECAMNKI